MVENNASPGSTGFSNEFYKFFWRDIKIFVVDSINHSFKNGMLSVTQRLGIITLIPKGDKDKTFLKNWRPLTLLNSIYKMVSGVIAERIRPALDTIIHGDQKGFVAGRYIGEAIRSTYDIMQWANENHKVGLHLASSKSNCVELYFKLSFIILLLTNCHCFLYCIVYLEIYTIYL